jgi:hypothetical protein
MEALRVCVWIERAAKRDTNGDEAAAGLAGILQHRATEGSGNLGGMIAAIGVDGTVVVCRLQS